MSMLRAALLVFSCCLIFCNASAFACDQIVNWHIDDREFFDGYYGPLGRTDNYPKSQYIGNGHTSVPVTTYASPNILHSDEWTGYVYIYSYDSPDSAALDFNNEDIFYRGDIRICSWVSKTSDQLIQGRCSFGTDIEKLYLAFGYALYRNCIIKISFGPPVGETTNPQTANEKVQILISQAKALIDSKCSGVVNKPETDTLKLHIDNHPLKNLKVIIDNEIYTTDINGEVEIPENGEATLQFIYLDNIEYFSIYVLNEKKPLELNIKITDGVITEGDITAGDEIRHLTINKKISEFTFENLAAELYSTAKRYIHFSEALEFYQDLGVGFDKPLQAVTFVNFAGKASYQNYKIIMDSSISSGTHEWAPFTEYHEFSHYAMNQMYGDDFFKQLLNSPNHGGFANPTTTDSWMEGFAAFMSVVIANHYDRWWTERPLEKSPSFYPMAGSLDANYKAWEREGKAEEFSIAGFLWDYIDGESLPYPNLQLGDLLYLNFFRLWDDNKDKKITAEEIYVGQMMDRYAKQAELSHITWYYMIELGKDMEDFFDLEPDMELFDTYDDGDGFLSETELEKMADILNDDGYLVASEWLQYYDDGDNKISKTEASHLLKGYEIIMEISKGKEVSDRNDVKEWVKDARIKNYIDTNGIRPIKNEMSSSEFSEYVFEQIASGKDDDALEWSFDVLWRDVLNKKHADFTSVLESLDIDDATYSAAASELLILHGMYQRKSPGDGTYNPGEAYADANKNKRWDQGETYIDYPFSWDPQEGDILAAPSNYERIGRKSTPYFKGNYIKAPKGEYDVAYLIKDGMKIVDIAGYTANSDGMLYVPIPSGSMVSVHKEGEDNPVVFSSDSFHENFDEIVKQGYIREIKNVPISDDDSDSKSSGGGGGGGCFITAVH